MKNHRTAKAFDESNSSWQALMDHYAALKNEQIITSKMIKHAVEALEAMYGKPKTP